MTCNEGYLFTLWSDLLSFSCDANPYLIAITYVVIWDTWRRRSTVPITIPLICAHDHGFVPFSIISRPRSVCAAELGQWLRSVRTRSTFAHHEWLTHSAGALCCFSVDIDAVAGWLGSYQGEDSTSDISRGKITIPPFEGIPTDFTSQASSQAQSGPGGFSSSSRNTRSRRHGSYQGIRSTRSRRNVR